MAGADWVSDMIIDYEKLKRKHAPVPVQYLAKRDADETRVDENPTKTGSL